MQSALCIALATCLLSSTANAAIMRTEGGADHRELRRVKVSAGGNSAHAEAGNHEACSTMLYHQQYAPHQRGGEIHTDLRTEVPNMQPSLARSILELITPRADEAQLINEADIFDGIADRTKKQSAKCTVRRWVQYAMCDELMQQWAPQKGNWTALSFGGNGYDEWSTHISTSFGVIPEVFDCFDPREVAGTKLHATCIGGKAQRAAEKGKHEFQDLDTLLQEKEDRSVLVKLDIEGSEFDVLHELTKKSLRKLGYLTVEFHFMAGAGMRCCGYEKLKSIFQKLADEFVVIDGAAMRWGSETDCDMDGGYKWPNAFTVSYIPKEFIHLQKGDAKLSKAKPKHVKDFVQIQRRNSKRSNSKPKHSKSKLTPKHKRSRP